MIIMWLIPAYRPIVGLLALLFLMPTAVALILEPSNEGQSTVRMLVLTNWPSDVARMEGSGLDIIEVYDKFVLVDADPTAVSAGGWSILSTAYDMYSIDMLGARFDTRDGFPDIRADLMLPDRGTDHGDVVHYIVQFQGPIKSEWNDRVASMGGLATYYIPNNAYIVAMDGSTRAGVEALPFVQWVGLYQPAMKVQGELLDPKKAGDVDLKLILHGGTDVGVFMRHLGDIDGDVDVQKVTPVSDGETDVLLTVDVTTVPSLARLDEVYFIEEVPFLQFWNGQAQYIVQSGLANQRPVFDHGIHGENQTIGNADSGIYVQHWAFHDSAQTVKFADPNTQPNDPPNLNHRKVVHYWTFADSTDSANINGHGTMTTGTNAGDSTPNGGDGSNNGQAYKAKLTFQDIGGAWSLVGVPSDLGNLFQPAYNDGARIHSNSWGGGNGGEYASESQDIDRYMWTHPEMLISFAAGNWMMGGTAPAGSVSPPSTAKDCMTVGAAEHGLAGDMKGYSERGPTDDGRIKPTIYTPTDIQSPQINTQNSYTSLGGTSGATPVAVGAATLVRQYYQEGWYPSGTKTSTDGFNASAALVKATMVNSGEETQGSGAHDTKYNNMPFPNNDQGYGYVRLDSALFFQGDNKLLYVVDNKDGLSTGNDFELSLNIVDEAIPFEVTLAWTDYEGSLGAGTELVNNLDLEITGPDLTVYKGNVYVTTGTPHQSTSGGSFDSKNVEETFLLKTPTRGGYKIRVIATNVAQGPQPFALVATGVFNRDPDLALLDKDFVVSTPLPMEGETVNINGTVRNNGGDILVPVGVKFIIDGVDQNTMSLDLGPTQRASFNVSWVAVAGNHTFEFTADPDNAIAEGSELNNNVTIFRWCNAMPKANITANATTVLTYEQVQFDASASTDDGPSKQYYFDFGDGKNQKWGGNPKATHIYTDEGVYNISVKVQDNMSLISKPDLVQVTVLNRAPIASARSSAQEVLTFVDIIFDSMGSTDKDGTFTFIWDFGDGATSKNGSVSHNFTDNGNYSVTLTLTDDDGATSNKSLWVNILDRPPTSYFEVFNDVANTTVYNAGNTSTTFTFIGTASDMDGEIAEYRWDMGDGNTSNESVFDYKFRDEGDYTIIMYVIDDDGSESPFSSYTVYISNLPPVADLSASDINVLTYENVSFLQKASDTDGQIARFLWDMGDGTTYEEADPTHMFKEDGLYAVTLTVWDDDNELARAEMEITVHNRAPVAVATYNFTVEQDQPLELDASWSTDVDGTIVLFQWTFNDTEMPQGERVVYSFPTPGQRTFTLQVTDNDGATDLINLNITVLEKPPPDEPDLTLSSAMGVPLWLLGVIVVFVIALVAGFMMAKRRKRAPLQAIPPEGALEKVATVQDLSRTKDKWREGRMDETTMGAGMGAGGSVRADAGAAIYGAPELAYTPSVEYENIYGEVVTDEQQTYETYDAASKPQQQQPQQDETTFVEEMPEAEAPEEPVAGSGGEAVEEAAVPIVMATKGDVDDEGIDFDAWSEAQKTRVEEPPPTDETEIFSGIQTNVSEEGPAPKHKMGNDEIPVAKAKVAKKKM